jgi:hypothetical protein
MRIGLDTPTFKRLTAGRVGYARVVPESQARFDEMCETLKKASAVLRDAEIPFALAGGFASWARGGPPSDHDLDFLVRPEDVDGALEAFAAAGMRPERPPEGWLVKAWDGDVLIDLIHSPTGVDDTGELIERADLLEVEARRMPVMRPEDLLVTKLSAMTEHTINYRSCLEIARALREQIDWVDVRRRTSHSPFARAFFTLVEGLEIVDAAAA